MSKRGEAKMQEQQKRTQQIQQNQIMVETERAKGEILATRGIAEERRTQAVENQADAGMKRAKTAAQIQDIGVQQLLSLLTQAIQLEGIGQQNVKAEAKS